MKRILWGLVLVAASALGGCTRAPEARFPNPMPLPSSDPVTVEKVARRVLLELRFDILYPDTKEGRVATDPLTGAQWFEFWRGDTVTAADRLESSLHTIRRTATVTVTPGPRGSQVAVQVAKERLSAPGTSPQSVGQTYNLFSPSKTDLARQDEFKETYFAYVPMGRDDALEQKILEQIQAHLGPDLRR
jgi:hypothetical protein